MRQYGLNELRERFLSFFEGKAHLRLPSFPLVPKNDKSLLLINSGMAPMKPYFTGAAQPPSLRVATCQKCVRTNDIDNVGKTARHATFFEMLGNFSFNDYFKSEAIAWAWEFFTKDLGFPEGLLYPSVYKEDDEAFGIWRDEIGIAEGRITRLGKADNFWEHGLGPCGPCSEIYFDRGPAAGCGSASCAPGCDCDRYVEIWNLVFTQFDRQEDGSYVRLTRTNIDTGMGVERLACVVQGVDNIFEVDTIRRLVDETCALAHVRYGADKKPDYSARVVADHIRSSAMLVADGVLPSNEGRGYVLRRLLRSAARHGRLIGIEGGFLGALSETVVELSGGAYPELRERAGFIRKIIEIEEARFAQTLGQGLALAREYIDAAKSEAGLGGGGDAGSSGGGGEPTISGGGDASSSGGGAGGGASGGASGGKPTISGDVAFKLHDTYGFPFDLTREIAAEEGVGIDEDGFKARMEEQRALAKSALKSKDAAAWGGNPLEAAGITAKTVFVGYERGESDTEVLGIVSADGSAQGQAVEGEAVTVVLAETPFYAESGGQAADIGTISTPGGEASVFGCAKTEDGIYLHACEVTAGAIAKGEQAHAAIDAGRRSATAKNHTATHLLHKALRLALGVHVAQAGSLVSHDRLRFDFSHFEQVGQAALAGIEQEVNERIEASLPVTTREMGLDAARATGAQAIFDEKYGDVVRVVSAGGYSSELCGGTHVRNTGDIGLFVVVSEGSVASGVRRIEGLTGAEAYRYLKGRDALLREAASTLKTTPDELPRRAESALRELKDKDHEIEMLKARAAAGLVDGTLAAAKAIGAVRLAALRLDQLDAEGLRALADGIKAKDPSCVAAVASSQGGKATFIVAAGDGAVAAGAHSGNLVRAIAKAAGGSGGGRADMAQAGGKDVSLIDGALALAPSLLEAMLGGRP